MNAFKFNSRSWLENSKAKNIILYTDSINFPSYDNSRFILRKFYDKSNDWIENVGRKTECILDYLKTSTRQHFCFIEADCYIVGDFSEVFDEKYDIAVTRLFSSQKHTHATVTCGVWFAQKTKKTIEFFERWNKISKMYKERKLGIVPDLIAYDQLSFTDIIRLNYVEGPLNVYSLDECVYNSEDSKENIWLEKITRIKPKILHFKGQRYLNEKLTTKVLEAAGVK